MRKAYTFIRMHFYTRYHFFLDKRTTGHLPHLLAVHTVHTYEIRYLVIKVRKLTKIKNRYNQAPHLAQVSNGKVTTSQLDIVNNMYSDLIK